MEHTQPNESNPSEATTSAAPADGGVRPITIETDGNAEDLGLHEAPTPVAKPAARAPSLPPFEALFGRVGQLLRLDVYGDAALTRRARVEMSFAGLLLIALFLFDFGAWVLFFRLIFASWGAVFAALLPTLVTIVYERQFLTADTSGGVKGWLRILPAFAIRLVIIVVVALCTAQPVELLIFKDRIAIRAHEESVRAEAVRLQMGLLQAQEKANANEKLVNQALSATPQAERLEKTKKELLESLKGQTVYEAELPALKKRAQELKSEVKMREHERVPADPVQARRAHALLVSAQHKLVVAHKEALEMEGKLAESRAAAMLAQKEHAEAKHDLDGKQKEFEDKAASTVKEGELTQGRLRDWIAKIAASRPGQVVYELETTAATNRTRDGGRGFEFQDAEYDFFGRLETLADLRTGRPPRWPETAKQWRLAMGQAYGLSDIASDDDMALARRAQEAADFSWMWRLVLLAAMAIPLMVIAMKFLMPPELKAYYTNAYQAAWGNPEIVEFRAAMARVRAEEDALAARRG